MNARIFALASIVAAIVGSLFALPAQAIEPPFAFATAAGNLPKDVRPIDYTVALVPDPDRLALSGRETVKIDVLRATKTLVLSALNLRYSAATVDGVAVAAIVPDDALQRTTITTGATLRRGRHTLVLAFAGKIETTGQGLFVQPFKTPDGGSRTMLSTQFEATDARRMFPCWDEPAFKATFALSVTLPRAWNAVSNMPVVGRVSAATAQTLTFARTPVMSSYLVELTAGDLAHIDGADANGTLHEIWAARGQAAQGRYALENSERILEAYDAYFGISFPLPRLASIAIPGGFGGAMENWGAITYNDQILLVPPGAPDRQKQGIYSVQAHEMAHQWFGDLVTMAWWDDIWLNESFASWMSARQTDLANPSWQWWQREDASKENAMDADAQVTSHPIFQHVTNERESEASFDPAITYDKGQTFLRMTEQYLGANAFRSGIRTYMRDHKYSNTTSTDLWNALSGASGKDVASYANSWIYQAGFPLLSVNATCDANGNRTVAVAQSRFLLTGSDSRAQVWQIPIGIASGSVPAAAAYTLLTGVSRAGLAAGRCDEPLLANAGNRGLYRVQYDDATFATNRAHFAALPSDDRIALLDDQWALAKSGKADLGQFLELTSAMSGDRNAREWKIVTDALIAVERDERGTAGHAAFTAYARHIFAPLYADLGWDAKPGETQPLIDLRETVLAALGQWGDPGVIAEAGARFAAFVKNREALSPNQQATVLTTVATYADKTTFDELLTVAKTAGDTGAYYRTYNALASVADAKLARTVLEIVASPQIPPQANRLRAQMVFTVAARHPALAYEFFARNVKTIYSTITVQGQVFIAQALPAIFENAAPLAAVSALAERVSPKGSEVYIERGVARARFDLSLKERLDAQANHAVASSRMR